MLETDLHSHTIYSQCGLHTILEMLNAAKDAGLKALAITDHGPALNGRQNGPFFDRLNQPVPGIQLLKGVECNVIDESGTVDLSERYISLSDVLLVGLHGNLPDNWNRETSTGALISALEKQPWLDIVTHPLNFDFQVDFRALAGAAREMGRALEFNVSKIHLGRVSIDENREFIRICKEEGCLVAVNTDSHAVGELGKTEAMEELMKLEDFPDDRVVNRTLESTLAWLEERRKFKI